MFVGMAPLNEPEIVIAVIVENGGAGGETVSNCKLNGQSIFVEAFRGQTEER